MTQHPTRPAHKATHSAPQVVLFDLDGTLADTFCDLMPALDAALASAQLPPGDGRAVRAQISRGTRAMVRAAMGKESGNEELAAELEPEFLRHYEARLAKDTCLFEGMVQVLDHIEQQGLAWGIVTNKLSRFTHPILDGLGIAHRVAAVVCGDSAERAKPHPDPLIMALNGTDALAHNALYVGDARNDVIAARAAGMPVIAAAYGYLAPGDDPHNWEADGVIHSPGELLRWLAG